MAGPKVELVMGKAVQFRDNQHIIFCLDPVFANMLGPIEEELQKLTSGEVIGFPVPGDSIKFFAIDETINISVDSPKIGLNVEAPDGNTKAL